MKIVESLENLRNLEKAGVLRLVLLLSAKEMSIIELRKFLGQYALYSAIETLKKLGLIEDTREEIFPRRRLLKLTQKGRKIALLIKQINEILEKEH